MPQAGSLSPCSLSVEEPPIAERGFSLAAICWFVSPSLFGPAVRPAACQDPQSLPKFPVAGPDFANSGGFEAPSLSLLVRSSCFPVHPYHCQLAVVEPKCSAILHQPATLQSHMQKSFPFFLSLLLLGVSGGAHEAGF